MSFNIKCNNCKSEIEIDDKFKNVGSENFIEIYSTMDGRIIIECVECGNCITSK